MAYDALHNGIKKALQANGFRVIKDPLSIYTTNLRFFIDLEMERNGESFAIEIKSFNSSFLAEFYKLLGQILIYRRVMHLKKMNHSLYTAITDDTWRRYFKDELPQLILKRYHLSIMSVNISDYTLSIHNY